MKMILKSVIISFLIIVTLLLISVETSFTSSSSTENTLPSGSKLQYEQFSPLNGQHGTFNRVIRKWIYGSDFETLKLTFKNTEMLHFLAEHLFNIAVTEN